MSGISVSPHHPFRGAYLARVQGSPSASASAQALHEGESALLEQLPPARRDAFIAGRLALREALRHTSPANATHPLLRTPRGAPMLPPGVTGSISHKQSIAVALAAPVDGHGGDVRTIGIDVEERPHGDRKVPDIARRVLTAVEQGLLPDDPLARREAVLILFALKEAVYKAIDPYVQRYVRFTEVEITPASSLHEENGNVAVTLMLPEFASGGRPTVRAHWWREQQHLFAVAATVQRV